MGYNLRMDEERSEARRLQIEIIRSWTPEQRLEKGLQMATWAMALRRARSRESHPGAAMPYCNPLYCITSSSWILKISVSLGPIFVPAPSFP